MEFADSYFEDEVREGFYVPSIMKKAWAAQLEVLNSIDELCRKHNISYFAEWGTLLGAIRHGGMIPWDDDFDICMIGKEYNKLLSVLDKLPQELVLKDFHSDNSGNMVIKIQNSKTGFVSKEILEKYHGFPFVAGVDIFRLDYLPRKEGDREFYRQLMLLINTVTALVNRIQNKNAENEQEYTLSQRNQKLDEYLIKIENLCMVKINRDSPIPEQLRSLVYERLSLLYEEQESDEVTMLAEWFHNENYRLPKSCYTQSIDMPFENMQIKIPVGYDELLRRKYGQGYMKPVRSCDSHEYPYFKDYEKYLFTTSELAYYSFFVNKKIILENEQFIQKKRKEEKRDIQEQALSFLPLLKQAHENISWLLDNGQTDSAYGLIRDCQDAAIQLGSMIEENMEGNHSSISLLEQYCEELFQIYQFLQTCEENTGAYNFHDISGKLNKFIELLKNNFTRELKRRKEVVFIPYKASYWNTMASAWREAMDSPDTDVSVIPAPYYYKDSLGHPKKEQLQYKTDGYPENVTITHYEKYNFQVHHPDVIVIQCPYDEFNHAMTIHPFFYAKNLKQYTEQLVYIPALVMDEIEPEDERAKKMLKSYCNMPGVVYADKVIVQSEQMKKIYVELLTEFAGEDTAEIWEQKITGRKPPVGHLKDSYHQESPEIPEEWRHVAQKPDGTRKEIILYSTSASALLCSGEKMIDKMKEVFRHLKGRQESTALIWRPDSKAREILRKNHPGLWQKYRSLVQQYKDEAWGIYDDSPDAERAIALCDSCYGDGGTTLNACRVQKKPIAIQDVTSPPFCEPAL